MSFIESYKRLDKLCGDILRDDRRLSAYIDEMKSTPRGRFYVLSWDSDLQQLKHYRWMRNQIAHEPQCTEATMCTAADALWLDNFYDRIMRQTDPLALYRKATQPHPTTKEAPSSTTPHTTPTERRNTMSKNTKPKKHRKGIAILAAILAVAVAFFAVVNLIPPQKSVENNPFIVGEGNLPMIAAHRGGGANNPENTMLAFRQAVTVIGVDIIESDLYLTKDGYLVYNHDEYIDETCNVNGDIPLSEVKALCQDESRRHYIKDMTLAELRQYNFGYYFENEQGERIYKDAADFADRGLRIATVEELFAEFYETYPDLKFIVEIKDGGDRGVEACRLLSDTLDTYPAYKDQIVIGTFNDEIEMELKQHYPHLLRGAPTGSAAKFVITQYLGVNLFDNGDFACLQIPLSYDVGIEVPLDKQTLIDRAHRRNIAVQYWTINDPDEMRMLIAMGVDCIMTDDPILLKEVLNEYR